MHSVPTMTKPSPPIPKRDFLPSSKPDHITRGLDEAYERGFVLGRAAGIETALQLLRAANIPNIGNLVASLTRSKYE
jgi:hypothetical protein